MDTRARPVIHFADAEDYPAAPPFHPPERYPELGFLGPETDPQNGVYAGVRTVLRELGLDAARFGTPDWSPLGDLVARGGRVVLKPNFVRHFSERPGGRLESVVTHPSVLRPLLDYAHKAVGHEGRVLVADAPQYDCEVETLLERNRLPELLAWYAEGPGIAIGFRDLRVEFGRHVHGIQTEKQKLAGDPEGYVAVDLGDASEFAAMPRRELTLLRGADYDEQITIGHHIDGRNEYLVARTVLDADLVVNVPKVKTHKKSGVTLSMKNLIGINGDKNWLPHYRAGFQRRGGDEFPRPDLYARVRHRGAEWARALLKRGIGAPLFRTLRAAEEASGLGERHRNGNWYGNDTIWRTCLDLNKILLCGGPDGRPTPSPPRRVLHFYDGVISGEGDGPMGPTERPIGLLAAGLDGGAVDAVLTWIMGFDWRRIPVLANAFRPLAGGVRISEFDGDPAALTVRWVDDEGARDVRFADIDLDLRFEAHPGWRGRIERTPPAEAAAG